MTPLSASLSPLPVLSPAGLPTGFAQTLFGLAPIGAPEPAPFEGIVSGNRHLDGGPVGMEDPDSQYHQPIMVDEVARFLQPGPGVRILDATVGGGGHSHALLQAGAQVIGVDRDPEALAEARWRCDAYAERFVALGSCFGDLDALLSEIGIEPLDGILFDLGVSSHQLDTPERGFSFQEDGPLDMRMNPLQGRTAADVINQSAPDELERIIREFGEESGARRIVRAITEILKSGKAFQTTRELAELVERVQQRRGRQHPATKVFQALRIEVNEELEQLRRGLEAATRWLKPGGRLAVITFHSLEDRIVKQFMRERSQLTIDRPEWPEARPNPNLTYSLVTRKPIVPSELEIKENPRARSAKLRVAERLGEGRQDP